MAATSFENKQSLLIPSLCAALASFLVLQYVSNRKRRQEEQHNLLGRCQQPQPPAYEKLIGSTPLVRLDRLSDSVGRSIWVKMESMNPGATGKDRAALGMIEHAEKAGLLPSPVLTSLASLNLYPDESSPTEIDSSCSKSENQHQRKEDHMSQIIQEAWKKSRSGGIVVEGTSGSTGIALATLSAARGHACLVVLPDDQATEKQAILKALGAVIYVVPTAAISNPNHYVNIARRLAEQACAKGIQAVFINQFENQANFDIHYNVTGPEIFSQFQTSANNEVSILQFLTGKRQKTLDAFIMSAGTGGTISGIGKYLKEQSVGKCRVVLVDPPGSSLYNKIKHGVAFAIQQREQTLQRHRYDTIAEGIGLDRVTNNLSLGLDFIDDAIRVSDQEAVDMAHFLLNVEGLWIGSSSAMNVVGAVRVALELENKSNVATVICDSGSRHVTRMWNRDFILRQELLWPCGSAEGVGQRIPDCLVELLA